MKTNTAVTSYVLLLIICSLLPEGDMQQLQGPWYTVPNAPKNGYKVSSGTFFCLTLRLVNHLSVFNSKATSISFFEGIVNQDQLIGLTLSNIEKEGNITTVFILESSNDCS